MSGMLGTKLRLDAKRLARRAARGLAPGAGAACEPEGVVVTGLRINRGSHVCVRAGEKVGGPRWGDRAPSPSSALPCATSARPARHSTLASAQSPAQETWEGRRADMHSGLPAPWLHCAQAGEGRPADVADKTSKKGLSLSSFRRCFTLMDRSKRECMASPGYSKRYSVP